jgi:hypothetical protein
VMVKFSDVRAKALSAVQAADIDRKNDPDAGVAFVAAVDEVRKTRKRVAGLLQVSGGAAVPSQRSDWYWEEYAGENGAPNETLVFVRYDISLDAVRALVERYSSPITVMGSTAITGFPALAWQSPDFTGGAILMKVGKPFAGTGIAPQTMVVAINEQPIVDATSFARRFDDLWRASNEVQLTVKPVDAPSRTITIRK